jgi:hypothetical protein
MRFQHASFLIAGLALAALLGACARQGQGEPCNTQGNDCQSPLICLPIQGSTELGTCCMANSQCGSAQNGFTLNQNDNDATTEAAASKPDAAANADAQATTDAFDAEATIDALDGATDARATTEAAAGNPDAAANADARATTDAFDDATDARETTDALTDAGGGG